MSRWRFIPFSSLATLLIIGLVGLSAATYYALPPSYLRRFSGPPPILSFKVNLGTGFFISNTGDIMTNRHVVQECRRITISGFGFRARRATLVSVSADDDLALLRIRITPPASLPIADGNWGDSINDLRASLTKAEFGHGTIIGYHAFATAAETDAVWLLANVITQDRHHWYRLASGLFIQGESGSPILYSSGQVAGVLFHIDLDKWTKQTADGLEGNTGIFVAGPVVKRFATAAGVNLAVTAPSLPAQAVVHIFCFATMP